MITGPYISYFSGTWYHMGCGIQYRILHVCTWSVSWFSAWDVSLFTDPNALNSTSTPTKWFLWTSREQFYWVLTYQLIRDSVAPAKPTLKSLEKLIKLVKDHHQPLPSFTVQQFNFNMCPQQEGESVSTFVDGLQWLSEHCKFEGDELGLVKNTTTKTPRQCPSQATFLQGLTCPVCLKRQSECWAGPSHLWWNHPASWVSWLGSSNSSRWLDTWLWWLQSHSEPSIKTRQVYIPLHWWPTFIPGGRKDILKAWLSLCILTDSSQRWH